MLDLEKRVFDLTRAAYVAKTNQLVVEASGSGSSGESHNVISLQVRCGASLCRIVDVAEFSRVGTCEEFHERYVYLWTRI